MIIDHNFHAMTMVIIYEILLLMDNIFPTYFVHDLLKFCHLCSVVDDPNARDNLMQAYGCKSGKTNSSHKIFASEIASSKKLE